SVYKLTAHIVLVTKYRKQVINKERLDRLHTIFKETLEKWDCQLLDFNSESDHCHLIVEFKPDVQLSKLIANLKTVSSRLIRKEYPELSQQYFYGKPYFWTGAYFVASCGGVTIEQLKAYVENQSTPKK
ncbi:MAG: IS200/IS605 family transposase, partial [Cyanobacteria bacterium P01_G01_bin.49]